MSIKVTFIYKGDFATDLDFPFQTDFRNEVIVALECGDHMKPQSSSAK